MARLYAKLPARDLGVGQAASNEARLFMPRDCTVKARSLAKRGVGVADLLDELDELDETGLLSRSER